MKIGIFEVFEQGAHAAEPESAILGPLGDAGDALLNGKKCFDQVKPAAHDGVGLLRTGGAELVLIVLQLRFDGRADLFQADGFDLLEDAARHARRVFDQLPGKLHQALEVLVFFQPFIPRSSDGRPDVEQGAVVVGSGALGIPQAGVQLGFAKYMRELLTDEIRVEPCQ